MSVHINPRQCLANLTQQLTDGGGAEFLKQEWRFPGTKPEMPTGDCAIVALVHAAFCPPTGQSYSRARSNLSNSIRGWMYKERQKGETQLDYRYRRFRQWLRPPKRDPIHGTPTHATSSCIRIFLGYEFIYPNEENHWYCICDDVCTYVLDVQIPGAHTMTVHQRVAYTTILFDPDKTEVGNVHWLNPEKTRELKATRQEEVRKHEEERQLWRKRCEESYGRFLPQDWESRPKLEDYY